MSKAKKLAIVGVSIVVLIAGLWKWADSRKTPSVAGALAHAVGNPPGTLEMAQMQKAMTSVTTVQIERTITGQGKSTTTAEVDCTRTYEHVHETVKGAIDGVEVPDSEAQHSEHVFYVKDCGWEKGCYFQLNLTTGHWGTIQLEPEFVQHCRNKTTGQERLEGVLFSTLVMDIQRGDILESGGHQCRQWKLINRPEYRESREGSPSGTTMCIGTDDHLPYIIQYEKDHLSHTVTFHGYNQPIEIINPAAIEREKYEATLPH